MQCLDFTCLSFCFSFVGFPSGLGLFLPSEITTVAGGRAGGVLSSARCSKHAAHHNFLAMFTAVSKYTNVVHYRSFSKGYHLFSRVLTHNRRINDSDWLIFWHCSLRI